MKNAESVIFLLLRGTPLSLLLLNYYFSFKKNLVRHRWYLLLDQPLQLENQMSIWVHRSFRSEASSILPS